tara:strand:- start:26 stop:271 length:246 start_codon:yes stop_codon:yes gene_type:complete
MKNMKYKIEAPDDERKVYDDLFERAVTLIQDHPPELVAGSLMAIAQRLYRTHLSDSEYKQMMTIAITTEVEPYEVTKTRLH